MLLSLIVSTPSRRPPGALDSDDAARESNAKDVKSTSSTQTRKGNSKLPYCIKISRTVNNINFGTYKYRKIIIKINNIF